MAETAREDKAPLPTKAAETEEEIRIEAALPVDAELPFQRKYWPLPAAFKASAALMARVEAEARAQAEAHSEVRAKLYRAVAEERDMDASTVARALRRELAKAPVEVAIVAPLPVPTRPQAEAAAPATELPALTPTARRMIQPPFWSDGRPLDQTIVDMAHQLGVSRDAVTDAIHVLNMHFPEKWPLKR
jgi:hypothetical protein